MCAGRKAAFGLQSQHIGEIGAPDQIIARKAPFVGDLAQRREYAARVAPIALESIIGQREVQARLHKGGALSPAHINGK